MTLFEKHLQRQREEHENFWKMLEEMRLREMSHEEKVLRARAFFYVGDDDDNT